jgi:hypothetical protein
MNREWIAFHLQEALEEISKTLAEIQSDPSVDEDEFRIAITHAYGHLNTAWNSRNIDAERIASLSKEDFFAWRGFPSNIDFGQ